MKIKDLERFTKKINMQSNGCWQWTSAVDREGYARFSFNTRSCLAHKLLYEAIYGEVEDKLQLDHLCRNRSCVNPAHLEPVTQKINLLRGESPYAVKARQTHCKWGHSLENPIINHGKRNCRTCYRNYQNQYRKRIASSR